MSQSAWLPSQMLARAGEVRLALLQLLLGAASALRIPSFAAALVARFHSKSVRRQLVQPSRSNTPQPHLPRLRHLNLLVEQVHVGLKLVVGLAPALYLAHHVPVKRVRLNSLPRQNSHHTQPQSNPLTISFAMTTCSTQRDLRFALRCQS
jgi:hypothetical protein